MSASETERPARAPRSTRDDPEAEARAAAATPLVLHSLHELGEVLLGALRLCRPRRIAEIGGEGGAFTRSLLDLDAEVVCVDPAPSEALRRLAAQTRLELVEGYSPGALEGLEPCDAYVVDGDHCYAVVRRELELIFERAPDAMVIAHDVGWPCGRRDFYYGPERLPAGDVHPHSFSRGVTVDRPELVDGGLSGAGAMAIAERAGGERNGVLTAVEDALAARGDEMALALIPCVYGVAVMYPAAAEWAPAMRAHLDPFDGSPLLARLEANRLRLLTRVLDLQGEVERRGLAMDRRLAALEEKLATLSAENLRLREERGA